MATRTLLTRAYAVLHVKAIDGERRRITGIATTPEADRMGDVVESLGITFKNPVPLLLYHDPRKPVGKVWFQPPTADGLAFEAELPEVQTAGTLRDRIEEAWDSLQDRACSVACRSGSARSRRNSTRDTQGLRFLKSEVLELSLVTIPANAGATVHTIKALDLAASGQTPARRLGLCPRPRAQEGAPHGTIKSTTRSARSKRRARRKPRACWRS